MPYHEMHPTPLDQAKLTRLQALEQKMGVTLIALEPDPPYARLSREDIAELQSAEKDLGSVLVAYRTP